MPSTAETQVIDSGNSAVIADSSSDEDDDAEATVLIPDATSAAPATPLERSTETSVLNGTWLFPESGPAAQETAIIESVPALDFGCVISGEAPAAIPPAAVAGDDQSRENAYDSEILRNVGQETVAQTRGRSHRYCGSGRGRGRRRCAVMAYRENDSEHSAALSTCTSASETYNTARDALDQALADTKDEQAITADQVADAATVSSLSDAIDEANAISAAAACGTSLSAVDLQHNAKTNQDLAQQLTDSAGKVTDAAKAVADSRDAKAEAGQSQRPKLAADRSQRAQTLLDNSLWAVADNTTRVHAGGGDQYGECVAAAG